MLSVFAFLVAAATDRRQTYLGVAALLWVVGTFFAVAGSRGSPADLAILGAAVAGIAVLLGRIVRWVYLRLIRGQKRSLF